MQPQDSQIMRLDTLENRLPESKQTDLVQSVVSDFKRWKQGRARLEAKWQECWEAYLCNAQALYTQPASDAPDRSRIVRPILYESVETIHAHLLNSLFPVNERFFSVIGKTEADQDNAQLIEEFLRNKLEDAAFLEKYALFLKQAIIIGNTVASVPWRLSTQTRRVQQPVQILGVTVGHQTVSREEVTYNGPDFDVLDIFDFLIDPNANDFERAKVIRKVDVPLQTLRRNPAYHNTDILKASIPDFSAEEPHKQAKRRAFGLDVTSPSLSAPEEEMTVSLLEAWGDFVIEGIVYENYVCVVANESTLIRFEPNPYDCGLKPFVFTTFIPVPNELYGIGAIEKSLGLQHAINTLTNQKLDVINLSINAPFTYLINDDVFDPASIVTQPGALIPVKSHDTLRPIQYLNNFTVAFTEIADLKAEVQEATGALRFFNGAADNGPLPRTATEVSALVQGGSQKFASFLSHLEQTSLEPFLRIVLENARQFIQEPQLLRVNQPNGQVHFQPLLPILLKSTRCQFRIDGSKGSLLKQEELQSLSTFLRLVEASPALRAQVNWLGLYKKIYRRLGFRDEADIFVATPNPSVDRSGSPGQSDSTIPNLHPKLGGLE